MGQSLLGVARGLSGTGVPWPEVLNLLAQGGIQDPRPENWYPLEPYLRLLHEVEHIYGRSALKAMGRAIPDTSRFPPDLDSMERVLHLLNVAYQVNHRGKRIGFYDCLFPAPRQAEVICANPYPCALDEGILERLLERHGTGGPGTGLTHLPGPECRRKGAVACRFALRW